MSRTNADNPDDRRTGDWTSIDFMKAVREGVRAVIDLKVSATSPSAGEPAPEFRQTSCTEDTISLNASLGQGPVLAVFFRGAWCPFCRAELAALQGSATEFRARGTSVVAVSGDAISNLVALSRELGLSFPVLGDASGTIAAAYGLRWRIPIDLALMHQALVAEIEVESGNAFLPIPGRFIITTERLVAYADVDPDYTRRPSPQEFFPVLDRLSTKSTLS